MRKRLLSALVATMMLVGTVVLSAPISAAHAAPPVASPLITCQNTVWVNEVSRTINFGGGYQSYVVVRALRDSSNNSYCGEVDASSTIWEPAGVCTKYTVDLILNGSTGLVPKTVTPPCGSQGYGITTSAASVTDNGSNFVYGQSYRSSDGGLYVDTPTWTVN